MSRKLLAFLLSELATVRVICKNPKCGNVTELKTSVVGKWFNDASTGEVRCPTCGNVFYATTAGRDNPFLSLEHAVNDFSLIAARVGIEFVVPEPPAPVAQ
jgi:hypothetical protein